jgi:hypothetical protein
MPKTAIDIIEGTTKVVRKGSVCGGSAPVLMVGCGVKTSDADGGGMPKSRISKSAIGLTKGW